MWGGDGGTGCQPYYILNQHAILTILAVLTLYASAGAHFSSIKAEFFFRSKASRMASPTVRLRQEKSALVWSGFRPHSVVSCDLPVAASTMQFAPCSPRSFLSRLRARKPRRVPRQSVRGSTALGGADGVNHSQLRGKELIGEVHGKWAACLTLPSVVLTLSMPAKCLAPSDPKSLPSTLKQWQCCVRGCNFALGGAVR